MPKIEIPIKIDLPENWADQVVEAMKKDPNADWVDVVRCGDCCHRYTPCCPMRHGLDKHVEFNSDDDWFCADGKRKDASNEPIK